MATLYRVQFTGSNATSLGPNWTHANGSIESWIIAAGTGECPNDPCANYWNSGTNTPAANQWSAVTLGIPIINADNGGGPMIRQSNSADTRYFLLANTADPLRCYKVVAGTYTELFNGGSAGVGVSGLVYLQGSGTAISGRYNGSGMFSVTDSSINTSGRFGIFGADQGANRPHIAWWSGGDFSAETGGGGGSGSVQSGAFDITYFLRTASVSQSLYSGVIGANYVNTTRVLGSGTYSLQPSATYLFNTNNTTKQTGMMILSANSAYNTIALGSGNYKLAGSITNVYHMSNTANNAQLGQFSIINEYKLVNNISQLQQDGFNANYELRTSQILLSNPITFSFMANNQYNVQAVGSGVYYLMGNINNEYKLANNISQSQRGALNSNYELKISQIISQSGKMGISANEIFATDNNISKSSSLSLGANQSLNTLVSSKVAYIGSFDLYERFLVNGAGASAMSGGFEANPSGDTNTSAEVLRNANFDIVKIFNNNLSSASSQSAQIAGQMVFNTTASYVASGAVSIDFSIYETFNAHMSTSGAYKGAYNITNIFDTQEQASNIVRPTLNANTIFTDSTTSAVAQTTSLYANTSLVDTLLSSVNHGANFDITHVYQDVFVGKITAGGQFQIEHIYNTTNNANIAGQVNLDFSIENKYGTNLNANVAYKLQAIIENIYNNSLDASTNVGTQISFGIGTHHVTELACSKLSPISLGATLFVNDDLSLSNSLTGSFIVTSKFALTSALQNSLGLNIDLSHVFKTDSPTVSVLYNGVFNIGNSYYMAVTLYEPPEVITVPLSVVTLLLELDKAQFFELSVN